MTKKLIWRLREQPTAEKLSLLVEKNILTKEEAKQILLSSETEEDRDKKSLQSEIKFLRELVEKLSTSRNSIITTIKEIEVPYRRNDWYGPYSTWGSGDGMVLCAAGSTDTSANINATTGYLEPTTKANGDFTNIKTF